MQKIINVLAVASAVVSLAVVGSAGYVYVRKDAIIESLKRKHLVQSWVDLVAVL